MGLWNELSPESTLSAIYVASGDHVDIDGGD
jgi:hypothetical protein